MNEALAKEIEGLRKLKTTALQARYRELFGEESRSSNRTHLFRRIAWRLQAKAQGDLSSCIALPDTRPATPSISRFEGGLYQPLRSGLGAAGMKCVWI